MAKSYMTDEQARRAIVQYGKRMHSQGFVVTNDGNISVRVGDNAIWATPTGVSKGYMTEEMMVKLDLDGNVLEGSSKPSSEIKMHLRVYNVNPEVNAVVHAHPVAATTFSIAGIPLDAPILVEAILQIGAIPIARYAKPGTYDVPDSIEPFCCSHSGVLLSNHGALTWGNDLDQAFTRMEVMENYAKVYLNILLLGKSRRLSVSQIDELSELRKKLGFGETVLPQGCENDENNTDVLPQVQQEVSKQC